MNGNIPTPVTMASFVDVADRADLEHLLFFNPQQHRVRERIIDAVRRHGRPTLNVEAGRVTVGVEHRPHVQNLFFFHSRGARPRLCGVVLYLREPAEDIFILHMAVQPDYSMGGRLASLGLLFRMVEEVKAVGRKLKGVRYVRFMYAAKAAARVPVDSDRLSM